MHQRRRRGFRCRTRPAILNKRPEGLCCGTFGRSSVERRSSGLLSSGSVLPRPELNPVLYPAENLDWRGRPCPAWTCACRGRRDVLRTPWLPWSIVGPGRGSGSEWGQAYHEDVEEGDSNHHLFGVDGCDSWGIEDQADVSHFLLYGIANLLGKLTSNKQNKENYSFWLSISKKTISSLCNSKNKWNVLCHFRINNKLQIFKK